MIFKTKSHLRLSFSETKCIILSFSLISLDACIIIRRSIIIIHFWIILGSYTLMIVTILANLTFELLEQLNFWNETFVAHFLIEAPQKSVCVFVLLGHFNIVS